jgi:hypothetical protein
VTADSVGDESVICRQPKRSYTSLIVWPNWVENVSVSGRRAPVDKAAGIGIVRGI